MIIMQTDDGRTLIWDAGAALVGPPSVDGQAEFEAALAKPIAVAISREEIDGTIVDDYEEVPPGSARHAREVMRSLGAVSVIADDETDEPAPA